MTEPTHRSIVCRIMTVAACMVSPEGVILGADSTSTTLMDGSISYWDAEQKIFEVGSDSSVGVVTWGLGRFDGPSYRTLIAQLGDTFAESPAGSMREAAEAWTKIFWPAYESAVLNGIVPSNQATLADESADPRARAEAAYVLGSSAVGFCFGGWCGLDRTPAAYAVQFDTTLRVPPTPQPIAGLTYWGTQCVIDRLFAVDAELVRSIQATGKWTGTTEELRRAMAEVTPPCLIQLPLREAIDLVHALIMTTIKVRKFTLSLGCGGRPEVAVISSDRPFRWVRHKPLDSAVE